MDGDELAVFLNLYWAATAVYAVIALAAAPGLPMTLFATALLLFALAQSCR